MLLHLSTLSPPHLSISESEPKESNARLVSTPFHLALKMPPQENQDEDAKSLFAQRELPRAASKV